MATKFWGFLTGWASYAELVRPLNTVVSFSCSFTFAALVSLSWFALLPKRKLPLSALGKDTLYPYLLHMPLIILLESGLQLDTLFKEWFTFPNPGTLLLSPLHFSYYEYACGETGADYLFNPIAYVLPKQWLKVK